MDWLMMITAAGGMGHSIVPVASVQQCLTAATMIRARGVEVSCVDRAGVRYRIVCRGDTEIKWPVIGEPIQHDTGLCKPVRSAP